MAHGAETNPRLLGWIAGQRPRLTFQPPFFSRKRLRAMMGHLTPPVRIRPLPLHHRPWYSPWTTSTMPHRTPVMARYGITIRTTWLRNPVTRTRWLHRRTTIPTMMSLPGHAPYSRMILPWIQLRLAVPTLTTPSLQVHTLPMTPHLRDHPSTTGFLPTRLLFTARHRTVTHSPSHGI